MASGQSAPTRLDLWLRQSRWPLRVTFFGGLASIVAGGLAVIGLLAGLGLWVLGGALLVMAAGAGGFVWQRILVNRYNRRCRANAAALRAEILERGWSPTLMKIRASRYAGRKVPLLSFQYLPWELKDRPRGASPRVFQAAERPTYHRRNMRRIEDGLASRGIALVGYGAHVYEGHADPHGWAIYGPYFSLSAPGKYLVAFRLRCQYGIDDSGPSSQMLQFDVQWPIDPANPGKKHEADKKVETCSSDVYEVVTLEIEYHGEPYVEIRLHPCAPRGCDVAVDAVSVLWLKAVA